MSNSIMSPMKRLKAHFENFNNNITHLNIRTFELQQREESGSSYYADWYSGSTGIKKAIESDFLRVYPLSDKVSFAFKFTFLSEDKKSVVEPQYLEIIFKEEINGKDIFNSSKVYTIDEAKELMRSINSLLKMKKSFKGVELLNFLKETTVPSTEQVAQDEKEFLEDFNYQSAELQSHLFAEIEYRDNLDEAIEKGEKSLISYQRNLKETKRIRELEDELRTLRSTVSTKVSNKREELEIEKNKDLKVKAKIKIVDLSQRVKNLARSLNETAKLPLKRIDEILNEMHKK